MTILDTCLLLARMSKSKKMGFGAVLVVDGQQYVGRNRQLSRLEKPPFPTCPWSIHAEQDAVWCAIQSGVNPRGGVMYIAGMFNDTGEVYIVKDNVSTCLRCFQLREKYGFSTRMLTRNGWRKPRGFKKVEGAVGFRRSNTSR